MQSSLETRPRDGDFSQVARSLDGRRLLVRMHGALDYFSAPEARRFLLEQLEHRPRSVVIDLGGVFVDSSGIGLLVQVAQLLRLDHADLRVVCDEQLDRVLSLHRLHELIRTVPSARAALRPRSIARRAGRVARGRKPQRTGSLAGRRA
jgi:anti-anti-sigma factor